MGEHPGRQIGLPLLARWSSFRLAWPLGLGALLTPYLIGLVLLIAGPLIITVALAFGHVDRMGAWRWDGWENFRLVLIDPLSYIALDNTLYVLRWSVPLRLIGALLLALGFNRDRRGVGLYRAAVYLPTVIPEAAYALLWLWIVNPFYGPLNGALALLGWPTPAWLVEPATAKWVFVMMATWQLGESFVVLLAALKGIPVRLYEAAAMDGASRWQAFWSITWPLLSPWLGLLVLRDVVLSFQNTFTANWLMTGGDPYYATLFLPLHIYSEAFDHLRLNLGAALTVIVVALTALIIVLLLNLLPSLQVEQEA